jgi:hypothetical protein
MRKGQIVLPHANTLLRIAALAALMLVPAASAFAAGGTCTATGTWTTSAGSGSGTWTKPKALHCNVPGTWTDTVYYYEWVLKKRHHHTLTGYVDFGGVPCTARTWPVTGTFMKRMFTVTATNPESDGCVSFWTYTMAIK